jgi:hypothetical protein
VSKVKKLTGVTSRRNVKPSKSAAVKRSSKGGPKQVAGKRVAQKRVVKRAGRKKPAAKARPPKAKAKAVKRKKSKAQLAKVRLAQLALANAARKAKAVAAAAAVQYAIKALDPQRKCGAGTTVQFLYRVDERSDNQRSTTHLVFFDRHGWYCEHGRTCPAVGHARKYNGQIARAS